MLQKIKYYPFFIKLFNWEYWSFGVVYAPIIPYWLWLCLKARSLFFFSSSNPTIKYGGFTMEGKKDIYDLMPQAFYPATILVHVNTNIATIEELLSEKKMQFPLVAKPNIGERGTGVKKLNNITDVATYASHCKVDFLMQQWIDFEHEAGIFYYRYPNQKTGNISGIVYKEFLSVVGNGKATIEDLLRQDKRYILQIPTLQKTQAALLKMVLPLNQKKIIVPYGNHCRGSKFLDYSFKIDDELNIAIDSICRQVSGFYFGRMDIKFKSWDDLKQQKNFAIIELNGAGSEPTHIYDPKHSIFFAWKEIIRHWNFLYKISLANKHLHNISYMNFKMGSEMFREKKKYDKLIYNHN